MQLATETKPHAAYVERLRRRLAKPAIAVKDARDGVLDCFVATYHEGLSAGLHGVLGVEAGPDQVARLAAGMFRKKLLHHGATFEDPTIEALARVKAEVDAELHFEKLPVEIQATHDRVCELLLAKAEGSLPHAGDHSSLVGAKAITTHEPVVPSVTPSAPVLVALPMPVPVPRASFASRPTLDRPVTSPLREAVAGLLEELAAWSREGRPILEIRSRLAKAQRLVETVEELESV